MGQAGFQCFSELWEASGHKSRATVEKGQSPEQEHDLAGLTSAVLGDKKGQMGRWHGTSGTWAARVCQESLAKLLRG
jgi:hypothetical protein